MLRIITNAVEARAELRRIGNRTRDAQIAEREAAVRETLQAVSRRGDRALPELTGARVGGSVLDAAYQQVPKRTIDALRAACNEATAFHQQRVPQSWVQFGAGDRVWGQRYTPLSRVGLYLGSSRALGAGAVLALAIPARVAGVERIALAAAPNVDGIVPPVVLVAAQEAGVSEVYALGGAAAIAALTYGTDTIAPVDAVVGAGNADVAIAKRVVSDTVGVDGLLGLTELAVLADSSADPELLAIDLLAQAERDPMAAAVLLTPDPVLAERVRTAATAQLQERPQLTLTEKAIAHYGLIAAVESLAVAVELANEFAPERLVLATEDPWELLPSIRHAGAIFLGQETAQALGDYWAGCDRALPTAGAARYATAVGVETFLQASRVVQGSVAGADAALLVALAEAEGRHSLAESVRRRQAEADG